jgi:hypothetical protein
MRRISELVSEPLKWTQPGAFKKHFELRAGDEIVAALHFRSAWGSFATGESAEGGWTFKRVGFWQTRVTVRALGSESDIASFRDKTWSKGGTLTLADGRELFATTSFWASQLVFQDSQREELIRFDNQGLLHLSSIVEIEPGARSMPELPWIVMLGWYLSIKMSEDVAGAAGAAAAAAG